MFAPRLLVALIGVATLVAAAQVAERVEMSSMPPDRVGFPADYKTFQMVRRINVPNKKQVGTVYANKAAEGVTDLAQLPYPAGAMMVFEWSETEKDATGAPITEADGLWRRTTVAQIDVMRREPGYGGLYGEARAGEWEFARYAPDGAPMKRGAKTLACAKCHRDAAPRDFVFRGRFPALEKK